MVNRKFGAFSSSVDSDKLAASVQAIILGLSSLIVFIGASMGIEIVPKDIEIVAAQVGAAISSIYFLFGILRKIVIRFTKKEV